MLAVLPDGHRLNRRRVDLADLAGDPFIIFPRTIGPNLYDSIIGACRAAGFAPSISMESPQISSAANLVSAGLVSRWCRLRCDRCRSKASRTTSFRASRSRQASR
ncbi:LysR substrate-binding domain-containing protein [Paraburkholderia sp. SIMBA_049]